MAATPLGLEQNTSAINSLRLKTTAPQPLNLGSRNVAQNKPDTGLFSFLTPREAASAGFGGAQAGLAVDTQGTSKTAAAFDILSATTSGALAGAPGGPVGILIGGGVGGLIGTAKAFFGVSQTRKAARARRRLAELAEKAQAESIRKEEVWRDRQRLDQLTLRDQTRRDSLVQQGWIDYQNKLTLMNNFVNDSQKGQQNLLSLLKPVAA